MVVSPRPSPIKSLLLTFNF